MQNFKQFLQESSGNLPTVNVQLEFLNNVSIKTFEKIKSQITKYIKENYKLPKFEIKKETTIMVISLHDVPQHLFDTIDFLGDLHDIASDNVDELADAFTYIGVNWPPAYKMTIKNHLTFLHVNSNQSLKGIEKLIEGSSAFRLDIEIESPAKPFGVLSILRVKGFDSIVINGPEPIYNDLIKVNGIIQKHYVTKDILECQEELIDAGLQQYAKF